VSITATTVKELRDMTGAGFMQCKEALKESDGDLEKAAEYLRKKGETIAEKKASRQVKEGLIHSYIHPPGKIGVMIELNCETDFVARNEDFQQLAKDLAMHIAASAPLYVDRESVPEADVEKEKRLIKEQALEEGKPEKVIDKIIGGRIDKFFKEHCLLEQEFVKDPDVTIQELLKANIAKLGENIILSRFVRYQVGEKFD
jgi:elongation factor Ts